jgi:hypothetical protein
MGNQKSAQTLKERYGLNYFSEIGKKGAEVFHKRYKIVPIGTSQYGIINRTDNSFVNYFGGMR